MTNKANYIILKKILGYIFIILAILLCIVIIGQISTFINTIIGVFSIFTGKLNAGEIGNAMGHLFYWAIYITLIVIFWKYGRKWTKKNISKY